MSARKLVRFTVKIANYLVALHWKLTTNNNTVSHSVNKATLVSILITQYYDTYEMVSYYLPWTVLVTTIKYGNCECIATRGSPTPCSPSCSPSPINFVAWAKFELAQPIRCRLRASSLLIRYVTLWPWPLIIWPWTCMVGWISCDNSMCQIWARSVNPRLSYWWWTPFPRTQS